MQKLLYLTAIAILLLASCADVQDDTRYETDTAPISEVTNVLDTSAAVLTDDTPHDDEFTAYYGATVYICEPYVCVLKNSELIYKEELLSGTVSRVGDMLCIGNNGTAVTVIKPDLTPLGDGKFYEIQYHPGLYGYVAASIDGGFITYDEDGDVIYASPYKARVIGMSFGMGGDADHVFVRDADDVMRYYSITGEILCELGTQQGEMYPLTELCGGAVSERDNDRYCLYYIMSSTTPNENGLYSFIEYWYDPNTGECGTISHEAASVDDIELYADSDIDVIYMGNYEKPTTVGDCVFTENAILRSNGSKVPLPLDYDGLAYTIYPQSYSEFNGTTSFIVVDENYFDAAYVHYAKIKTVGGVPSGAAMLSSYCEGISLHSIYDRYYVTKNGATYLLPRAFSDYDYNEAFIDENGFVVLHKVSGDDIIEDIFREFEGGGYLWYRSKVYNK